MIKNPRNFPTIDTNSKNVQLLISEMSFAMEATSCCFKANLNLILILDPFTPASIFTVNSHVPVNQSTPFHSAKTVKSKKKNFTLKPFVAGVQRLIRHSEAGANRCVWSHAVG